jgi:hypothetical protein
VLIDNGGMATRLDLLKHALRSLRPKPRRSGPPLSEVLLVVAAAILCGSCDRHVHVTREMAWECLPAERDPGYPDAEPVMFRYTENPAYYDFASGRGLCQQLRASGKSTAEVKYEVWGTASRGLHGYHIELINGLRLQDIGGPARSGYHGNGKSGQHPLTRALR